VSPDQEPMFHTGINQLFDQVNKNKDLYLEEKKSQGIIGRKNLIGESESQSRTSQVYSSEI